MSEAARGMTETVFNIAYLFIVWWLVIAMWRRRSLVLAHDQPVARLIMWAFFWLGLGDIGHVGFRVVAFALDGPATAVTVFGTKLFLAPLGSLATAITFTFFYVIMIMLWHDRFKKPYGFVGTTVFVLGAARLLIMALPWNDWNSLQPPFFWAIARNIPLMLMQLAVAYLMLRDAVAYRDTTFLWIGTMIVVSFLCYAPVIFMQQKFPAVGMLMIPKTIAYLVIAVIGFCRYYRCAAVPISNTGGIV
ncbi:MAG: hypothetical protein N3B18_05780 [Desulfobacterota bacterium]|nr:hypothetical protein [Thermodesulfobacteriota bacterium]